MSEETKPLPNCKVATGEAKPVGWRDKEKPKARPRREVEEEE